MCVCVCLRARAHVRACMTVRTGFKKSTNTERKLLAVKQTISMVDLLTKKRTTSQPYSMKESCRLNSCSFRSDRAMSTSPTFLHLR